MLIINKHNFTNIILKLQNVNPIIIGIGYPLNYLDSQDKLYKYLQLHRFPKFQIPQRIKTFTYTKPNNKLPLSFDTNMLPYFKELNDTLFVKKRFKLGNYDYRCELNEQIIDDFCQEFYNELHSQVIYNFESLIQHLQKRNIIIKYIDVEKEPEEHIKQIFWEHLGLNFRVSECVHKNLVYTPGFMFLQ